MVVESRPKGNRDPIGARQRVADRSAELVPRATAQGIRMVLEPRSCTYAADRAALLTLSPAPALAVSPSAVDDGVIDFPRITRAAAAAGNDGPLAVGIIKADTGAAAAREVQDLLIQRRGSLVQPWTEPSALRDGHARAALLP